MVVHLLAIVLLIAAFGKAAAETTISFGPIPWELVAGVEAAAGILLVAFRRSTTGRAAVGSFFLLLAGTAFSAVWRGLPSCNCLGELPIAPWKMLALDLFGGTWLVASAVMLVPHGAAPTSKSARLGFGFAALAAVALTVGAASGSWVAFLQRASQPLQIDPAELELGSIWLQEEFQYRLTVTNKSNDTVTVTGFDASCACTQIEPATFQLAPSESRCIVLRIDLFQIAAKNWNADHWGLDIQLRAYTGITAVALGTWRLTGRVTSPLSSVIAPPSSELKVGRFDDPNTMQFEITLKPTVRLRGVVAQSRGVTASVSNDTGSAHHIVRLLVNPRECDSAVFTAEAKLLLADTEDRLLPAIPLALPVTIIPAVACDTRALLLNDYAPRSLSLTSSCGRPFRIVRVEESNGVATELPHGSDVYAMQHSLTCRPLYANDDLSLTTLLIHTEVEDGAVVESLAIFVQLSNETPS